MAKVTEALGSSIKSKVLGLVASGKVSAAKENPNTLLKIIGKNFMSLPGFARDLNVARQNIQKLVKLEGGDPAKGADAQFLKEGERAKKVEVESGEKKEEDKKPTLVSKGIDKLKDKGKKKFQELKTQFSESKIAKKLAKFIGVAAIVGIIFVAFKDTFAEWVQGLWSAISEKFNEFVGNIKQWFEEIIPAMVEKLKAFVQPIIDTVSGFFSKIGDFFVSYFEIWRDVITSPITTIKKVYDAFMGKVNKIIDMIPEGIKKRLGIGKKEEPVVDDSAEKKKLERQQKEALETERIKKLEKEKQYTGEDEIVRARLGLPEKTETMRREAEMAKAPPPVEPAPPPAPIIVPSPIPPVKKEEAKPKAKAPVQAVAPKVEPKPSPTEAEKPKAAVGSLTSVTAVQPGVDLSFSPQLEERVSAMAADFKEKTGKKLLITSGFRSNEKQKQLYDDWKAGKLKAPAVAQPMPPLGKGKGSAHMFGTALDINSKGPAGINTLAGSIGSPTGWLESFGLTRPIKGEDWHVQLPKTPPTADNPFSPGSPIPVPTKDGKAVDVASGKKETVLPNPPSPKSTGSQVAASSAEVAAGQRQQMKPQTPVIVNAPVTNTTTITQNKSPPLMPKQDSARMLTARIA